ACKRFEFLQKFSIETAKYRNLFSGFHADLFDARFRMKYLVAPFLRRGPELEDRQSVRGLQPQLAVNYLGRLDRRKRNLQPERAAKKDFARFQQRLPFRRFL